MLVATSGSCGRWVLVGVMQIPDTGHGPHATRRLTSLPSMETFEIRIQKDEKLLLGAVEELQGDS